jgi:starvation-inducible outer membrane lipoprotein
MLRTLFFPAIALLLTACASVPESFSSLTWQDQRGDRGQQVRQRDLAWCLDAVETRRSLHEQCMIERGWALIK